MCVGVYVCVKVCVLTRWRVMCVCYMHATTLARCTHVQDAKFFTLHEVVDARRQSADRYTCEAVYSRVKQFRVLTGRQPIRNLQYINAAWYVAHMAANMYKPLALPDTIDEWRDTLVTSSLLDS